MELILVRKDLFKENRELPVQEIDVTKFKYSVQRVALMVDEVTFIDDNGQEKEI